MLSANAASGNTNFHSRKKHSKTTDVPEGTPVMKLRKRKIPGGT